MDSQYLIKQDPFFDTRERLIVEERLIHVYPENSFVKPISLKYSSLT